MTQAAAVLFSTVNANGQWTYATTNEWWSDVPCPLCNAPAHEVCRTRGKSTPCLYPHSDRMQLAHRLKPPAPPEVVNPYKQRALERRMHLADQAVGGPYYLHHDQRRGEIRITGSKLRTNGQVTIAVFKYRASSEMYFPLYEQALVYADVLVSRLNEFNLIVKDPRSI